MIRSLLQFFLNIFFGVLFRLEKKEEVKNFDEVCNLYAQGGFGELFAKIRIWDAPIEDLENLVPQKGLVIDLGCGDGLITNYIALKSSERQLVGIDKNRSRIKEASRGVANAKFFYGDVLSKQVPKADAVLMVHLLHHLPSYQNQEALIQKCRSKLRKGGKLVIAEIDRKPILKYLLTWLVDRIVFPILFEGKIYSKEIFYRKTDEWKKLLTELGFKVDVQEAHLKKPFSHVILIGEKC